MDRLGGVSRNGFLLVSPKELCLQDWLCKIREVASYESTSYCEFKEPELAA